MIPTGVEWLHFSETTSFTFSAFEGTAGPKNCVLFRFGKCLFLPTFVLLMEVKMVPASYLVVHLAQFYKTYVRLTPIRPFWSANFVQQSLWSVNDRLLTRILFIKIYSFSFNNSSSFPPAKARFYQARLFSLIRSFAGLCPQN